MFNLSRNTSIVKTTDKGPNMSTTPTVFSITIATSKPNTGKDKSDWVSINKLNMLNNSCKYIPFNYMAITDIAI
jgi:hypothetical protein